jgi:hypothetical protein
VDEITLQSGWESTLVAIPFVLILLAGIFRLDVLFAAPKRKGAKVPALNRPACGVDENGRMVMADPDGRPWRAGRSSR